MKQNYFLMFFIILGVQLLICNYFYISPYITLSLLPCIILLLPTRIGTLSAMLIAFASGLAVDFLAEGVVGLNALALVPVAASRRFICNIVFGNELVSTGEDVSMMKFGATKLFSALAIGQFIFLFIYIWADGSSVRNWPFILLRFALSWLTGVVASLFLANLLDPNERK